MTRLQRRRPDDLTARQRELAESLEAASGRRSDGYLGGPFDGWILSPAMGRAAAAMGMAFEQDATLDRAPVKIAILTVAARYRANYPWAVHRAAAIDLGVPEAAIDALRQGRAPDFDDQAMHLTHRLATELLDTGDLDAASYQDGVDELDEPGMGDLVNLTGFYVMVAMTNNAFRSDVPESTDHEPFPRQRP